MFSPNNEVKILIVDDDKDTCELFSEILSKEYCIITSTTVKSAIQELSEHTFQIVITDLIMPQEDGLDLIKQIKKRWNDTSILAISGKASIESAVEAIKLGAEEFLIKPIRDFELIHILIQKILKKQWLLHENKRLNAILQEDFDRKFIIGSSYETQSAIRLAQKVAPLDTSVLITGETGVGKSLFAKMIHENSPRKDKPFITVNCGSIPETLLESHLFGHKRGAFTGAIRDKMGYFSEANGGTLFLDEITETSLEFQVKLLYVLETNLIRKVGDDKETEIDARFLFATNKDIEIQVKKKLFRQDLFYRINVINLKIPPLRKRKNDIVDLAKYFLKHFSQKYNKANLHLSNSAIQILRTALWEGNVRELRNVLERTVILAEKKVIQAEDLPIHHHIDVSDFAISYSQDYHTAKDAFEKHYFLKLLKEYGGNISKVAAASGIIRQNLYPKLKKLELDIETYR
jgi:DNA-binding NtrC family response regulator